MKQICPKCGSKDVRKAMSRHAFDWFWLIFSYVPYRCRSCMSRFHAPEHPHERPQPPVDQK